MNKFLFLFSIFSTVLLEGSVTTLPLTLSFLLIVYIFRKDAVVFPLSFLSGILLDLLRVRSMGSSSIFFVVFFFIVFLYERKFEVETVPFVFFASLLGSSLYSLMIGYNNSVFQSVGVAFLVSAVFLIIRRFIRGSFSPLTPLV